MIYGDKTISPWTVNKDNDSINGRDYKAINLEYYILESEFKYLRINRTFEQIRKDIGFPGELTTFRRLLMAKGWCSAGKPFSCDETFFTTQSRGAAWVLGWLVTDGFISERYVKLDLQKQDIDVLVKVKNLLKFEGNIYESKVANGMKVYSVALVESLVSLGVPLKDKTFSCPFPKVNEARIWDFMRGAFEGDGCIRVSKGCLSVNICGAAAGLMQGVEAVLHGAGISTRIEQRGNLKVLTAASQTDSLRWLLFMYENTDASIRMDRKFNKFVDFIRTYYDRPRKSPEAAELIERIRRTIPECAVSTASTPELIAAA